MGRCLQELIYDLVITGWKPRTETFRELSSLHRVGCEELVTKILDLVQATAAQVSSLSRDTRMVQASSLQVHEQYMWITPRRKWWASDYAEDVCTQKAESQVRFYGLLVWASSGVLRLSYKKKGQVWEDLIWSHKEANEERLRNRKHNKTGKRVIYCISTSEDYYIRDEKNSKTWG